MNKAISMMRGRICEFCGERFYSRSVHKKYCSEFCRRSAAIARQMEKEQLCWRCKNACGKCSWSRELQPINGWDAEPVMVEDGEGNIRSYKIKKCPEYIFG